MSMAAAIANTDIVVLNLNNYEEWSIQVKTYLMSKGLWDIVVDEATAETRNHQETTTGESEYKDWRKNAEALHAIQSSCGIDVYGFIRDSRRAKDAWETLATRLKQQPVAASRGRRHWFGPCRPYPRI